MLENTNVIFARMSSPPAHFACWDTLGTQMARASVQLKNDKSLADLSAMLGPILRGWQQYYGHIHGSALQSVWRRVNRSMIGWLMRKHKKLAGHKTRAAVALAI